MHKGTSTESARVERVDSGMEEVNQRLSGNIELFERMAYGRKRKEELIWWQK
jgi:hypothetical protein